MSNSEVILTRPEIEEQVLGALILAGEDGAPEKIFEAHGWLRTPDVFTTDGTARRSLVYQALYEIATSGTAPTRFLVKDWLASHGTSNPAYVDEFMRGVRYPTRDAFVLACESLVEAYRLRTVRDVLRRGLQRIESGADASSTVSDLSRQLLDAVVSNEETGGFIGAVTQAWEEQYDADADSREHETLWWVSFGVRDVDELIGAQIRGGQLVVIAAHSKVGKTTLGVQLLRANGLHGKLVPTMLSFEMPEGDIVERMIAAEASIPYDQITNRTVQPGYRDAFQETRRWIREDVRQHGWVEHMSYPHLSDVVAKIRALVARYGTKLVIIDYVQLIRTDRNHSREREVAEIGQTLKGLAMDLEIVIVACAQLNDEILGRHGSLKRPLPTDTRESKNLSKDADIVCLIDNPTKRRDYTFWDDAPAHHKSHTSGYTEFARLDFDYSRRGKGGWVTTAWRGEFQRFEHRPAHIQPDTQPGYDVDGF